jgi:fibronectin type 3 domain-containing protein
MTARRLRHALVILAATAVPATAQEGALLAAPTPNGTALRWAWPIGPRPLGYVVERREGDGPWSRHTARPITRVRDRATARARLGADYDRYEGLLFPDGPTAELADPETSRSLSLLAADLSPAVATLLGLRYDDTTATAGVTYAYRLVALNGDGERIVATSTPVVAGQYVPPPGPGSLRAAQEPAAVALRWMPDARFSGYHVFRSRGDRDRQPLSETPVVVFIEATGPATESSPTFFRDTTVAPGDSLTYWVVGIDAFGRASQPSAPAGLTIRDLTAPAPPPTLETEIAGDTVVLRWPASPDHDVATYQTWRAPSRDGPFERLGAPVPSTNRQARDPGRPAGTVVWYRVTAQDRSGLESEPSSPVPVEVPDLVAPLAPDSLVGLPDTGRIVLRWRPVAAADLRGYRIYRASDPGHASGLLTAELVGSPTFTDSIPRGADHPYYYRVTAVDSAFNESAPSPVLAIAPPDVTPPSAPRIATVTPGEDLLVVRWLPNPERDVVAYRLRYRARGDSVWIERPDSLGPADHADSLRGIEPRRRYEIALVAVDDAGNRSEPSPAVTAEAYHRQPPRSAELRRARVDPAAAAVTLEWGDLGPGVARVEVLRRVPGGQAVRLGTVGAAARTFLDRPVPGGSTLEYGIRVLDAYGNAAEPRAWKRVTVRAGTP